MQAITLDDIPFQPDLPTLLASLRLRPGSQRAADLECLAHQAQAIAKPKALYRVAFVDEKGDDFVVIDGARFQSRILRVNLESAHRIFAYLITAGIELDCWAHSNDDLLHRFWADAIQEQALFAAHAALQDHLAQTYQPGPLSAMNPGSLEDWPLDQQPRLFSILGDTGAHIGVRLTGGFLMVPTKSVSGVLFPTEESFQSCQLCPRENCPGRRAPYDPGLFERKYHLP